MIRETRVLGPSSTENLGRNTSRFGCNARMEMSAEKESSSLSQIIVPSRLMTRIRGVKIVKSLTNPLALLLAKSKL